MTTPLKETRLPRSVLWVAIAVGLTSGAYFFSADILNLALQRLLASQGMMVSSISARRIQPGQITISSLLIENDEIRIQADNLELDFDWQLLGGMLNGLTVDTLKIDVNLTATSTGEPAPMPLPDMPALLANLPVHYVNIGSLSATTRNPDTALQGSLEVADNQLNINAVISSTLLPDDLDAVVRLAANGDYDLAVSQAGVAVVSIKGHTNSQTLKLSGQISLSDPILHWLSDITNLSAVSNIAGRITGTIDASMPWTSDGVMDWQAASANSDLAIQLVVQPVIQTGSPAVIAPTPFGELKLHSLLGAELKDQMLHLNFSDAALSVQEINLDGVSYQAQGTQAAGLMQLRVPVSALTDIEHLVDQIESTLDMTLELHLASQSTTALASSFSAVGKFTATGLQGAALSGLQANTTLDIQLKGPLLIMPELRGLIVNGEVTASLQNSGLQVSASAVSLAATDVMLNNIQYSVEQANPTILDLGLSFPLGTINDQLLDMKNISGTLNANLDVSLSSDDEAAPVYYAAVNGSVAAGFEQGIANIDMAQNFLLTLAMPEQDIEATAEAPANIRWDTLGSSISSTALHWSFSIPELKILDQRLAFRGAQLNLGHVTADQHQFNAKGRLTTRDNTQAFPIEFETRFNLDRMTGEFSVKGNHQVSQSLLKHELPGWRTSADLDKGAVDFFLTGNVKPSDSGFLVSATGLATVVGGVAHQGDISMENLTVRLPLQINNNQVSIDSGDLTIGSAAAGVPVTDITANFTTDLKTASISNVRASTLGAQVHTSDFVYDIENRSGQLDVFVNHLPVANVLALEGDDIEGEGILDGKLPMTLTAAYPSIKQGVVVARAPGGRLAYQGELPATNAALDLAVLALRNFHYSSMNIDVGLVPEGDLDLLITLVGKSPDVERGRPIHFNLNVSENLPALLESLKASEGVTGRLE